MLQNRNILATIPVRNIDAAREFYEQVVGLTPNPPTEPGVVSFRSGDSTVLVYQSQFAGTNRATAATWMLDDELDETVAALRDRGVTFEHYDLPGVERAGDVHVTGNSRAAWFKDPDGNILALVGR